MNSSNARPTKRNLSKKYGNDDRELVAENDVKYTVKSEPESCAVDDNENRSSNNAKPRKRNLRERERIDYRQLADPKLVKNNVEYTVKSEPGSQTLNNKQDEMSSSNARLMKTNRRKKEGSRYLELAESKSEPKFVENDVEYAVRSELESHAVNNDENKSLNNAKRVKKNLREKKKINYREFNEPLDGSDVEYTVKSEPESDSSSSGNELFSKKKKLKPPEPEETNYADLLLAIDEDEHNETNEYRQQRIRNMEDRLMVLKTIDFEEDVKTLQCSTPERKIVSSKRTKPSKKTAGVIRKRSQRLLNRTLNEQNDQSGSEKLSNSFIADNDDSHKNESELIEDEINICQPEDLKFLENLKQELDIPYDSVCDFVTCDFDKFHATVKSCRMSEEPIKIIQSRIVSLDFHPSENKLLLLSGDKSGNVGLWDLTENDGFHMKTHAYNVNCVSFSTQDKTKFFTTSLDGTVRQGDINNTSINLIYSAKDQESDRTTWHHELGHTLLVADSGNGVVKLVDLRAPNTKCPYFKCHKRSVRTVQTNPVDDNYCLTSSGMGFFGVWDLRHIDRDEPEPLILEEFNKGLTSAFYSPQGNYVLTTGNDDTIRVYQCKDNAAEKITHILHNNHGGRWLSVFKARWQPSREDCFYVGSMMSNPKRIQAYKIDGTVINDFTHQEMTTYNPVVTVHPTKPIIVGGNGSGRIHVFSPFRNLNESGNKLL